jgi:tRNA1(Val) A37 N6-methylase TrmN6
MSSPSPTTKRRKPGASQAGATSTDDFLGGRISVLQPRRGHRAGSDAVFLAASIPARADEQVLDVGAGVGVAGLCLLARIPGLSVTAVEIDGELCALAAENAARNGFGDRFTAVKADVTLPGRTLGASGLKRESYHHVIANPPFYAEGSTRAAPDRGRSEAHVMRHGALAAWVRFFAAMAARDAYLTLIHRPDSLNELLNTLDGRFGGVAVLPLFPKRGEPAARIILQAKKGSRAGLSLLPGLVLHEPDGRYTENAEAILRGGEPLVLRTPDQKRSRRLGG